MTDPEREEPQNPPEKIPLGQRLFDMPFLYRDADRGSAAPDADDKLRVKPVLVYLVRESKRVLEQFLRGNVDLVHDTQPTPNQAAILAQASFLDQLPVNQIGTRPVSRRGAEAQRRRERGEGNLVVAR